MPVANGEPVTGVSAPVEEFTENTDTVLPPPLAVASSPPDGLNTTECGSGPVANGEPVTWVTAPVEEFTENTAVLPPTVAVASSPPDGLNATETGFVPVANGEPVTGVSAPPSPPRTPTPCCRHG